MDQPPPPPLHTHTPPAAASFPAALALLFGDIAPPLLAELDPRSPQFLELHRSYAKPTPAAITQAVGILRNLAASAVPDAEAMGLLGWCYNRFGPQRVGYSEAQSDLYFKKATYFGSHFAITETFRQLSRRQPLDVVALFLPQIQPVALKGFKRAKYYIALTYEALGHRTAFKREMLAQSGAPGKVLAATITCFEDLAFSREEGVVLPADRPRLLELIGSLVAFGEQGWLHVAFPLQLFYQLAGVGFEKEREARAGQVQAQRESQNYQLIAFYFEVGKVAGRWLQGRGAGMSGDFFSGNDIFIAI